VVALVVLLLLQAKKHSAEAAMSAIILFINESLF